MEKTFGLQVSVKIWWNNWSMCDLYHVWAWMDGAETTLAAPVPSLPSALCSLIQSRLFYLFILQKTSVIQVIYRYVACFKWDQISSCCSPQLNLQRNNGHWNDHTLSLQLLKQLRCLYFNEIGQSEWKHFHDIS